MPATKSRTSPPLTSHKHKKKYIYNNNNNIISIIFIFTVAFLPTVRGRPKLFFFFWSSTSYFPFTPALTCFGFLWSRSKHKPSQSILPHLVHCQPILTHLYNIFAHYSIFFRHSICPSKYTHFRNTHHILFYSSVNNYRYH